MACQNRIPLGFSFGEMHDLSLICVTFPPHNQTYKNKTKHKYKHPTIQKIKNRKTQSYTNPQIQKSNVSNITKSKLLKSALALSGGAGSQISNVWFVGFLELSNFVVLDFLGFGVFGLLYLWLFEFWDVCPG